MEEKESTGEEGEKKIEPKRPGAKSLLIVIIILVLAIAGAGAAYFFLLGGKSGAEAGKETKKDTKTALLALDPFILNLAEQGRFLKVTMQLEIADASQQQMVNDKIAQIRDAIITLVSSKSVDTVSSPEGKFQLKDEILLRANQAVGKGVVFKNLYFTEFVMQ